MGLKIRQQESEREHGRHNMLPFFVFKVGIKIIAHFRRESSNG